MRNVNILIVMSIFLFFALTSKAQTSSTISSIGIDAKVIAPISIENTGSTVLNFGTVTRSSAAGTIVVTADGERSATGGASVLTSSAFSAAPFSASGENNADFSIALPDDNDVVLTREGGTETMEVTNFGHNSGLVLSGSGVEMFSVGATLNLDADQVAGDYSGSFSVTINYQ